MKKNEKAKSIAEAKKRVRVARAAAVKREIRELKKEKKQALLKKIKAEKKSFFIAMTIKRHELPLNYIYYPHINTILLNWRPFKTGGIELSSYTEKDRIKLERILKKFKTTEDVKVMLHGTYKEEK